MASAIAPAIFPHPFMHIGSPDPAFRYRCKTCATNLKLKTADICPPTIRFQAGNKNTLSFARVRDPTRFTFEKEDKKRFQPFFETLDYWGFRPDRTKIKCGGCGSLLGHIYDDGPRGVMDGTDDHKESEWVGPRQHRYRFSTDALEIMPDDDGGKESARIIASDEKASKVDSAAKRKRDGKESAGFIASGEKVKDSKMDSAERG